MVTGLGSAEKDLTGRPTGHEGLHLLNHSFKERSLAD
jgi:hypothetical protein